VNSATLFDVKKQRPLRFIQELHPLLRLRWLQLSALVALLTGIGAFAFQLKFSVLDFDIWWHLKLVTG